MKNELVSVIITTYKRDIRYVKEALRSVVEQTYSPIEVIVVDDNGKHSRYENDLISLCSQCDNVIYLQNENNSGAQVARNNGIKKAKGNFIAFLDDDDLWMPTKIEKQMKMFTRKTIGMVFCDGYSFEDNDKNKLSIFREVSIYEHPITFQMQLFNDYIGSTSQALIRKVCFDKVGMFDINMPARQDYEMWLRLSRNYEIVGCPEKLLLYRKHSGERISTNFEKSRQSYLMILKKYHNDYDKNRYAKAKLILRIFVTSYKLKDISGTIYYLLYAICCSPICVFDVIKRNITQKSFVEYYKNII